MILTYARSSVVEGVLLEAKRQGKEFSVVVVDSRPLYEGTLSRLVSAQDLSTEFDPLCRPGRQAPLALAPTRRDPDHLCPPPFTFSRPPARLALPPRDARPFVGRRHVLARRNGPRRHDAPRAERPCRVLLRDVQVLRTRHARFDRRERARSVRDGERLLFPLLRGSDTLPLGPLTANPAPLLPSALSTPAPAPVPAVGKPSSTTTATATASAQLPPNLSPLSLLYDVSRPEDVTVVITEAGLIPVQSVPVLLRDYKPVQGRNS